MTLNFDLVGKQRQAFMKVSDLLGTVDWLGREPTIGIVGSRELKAQLDTDEIVVPFMLAAQVQPVRFVTGCAPRGMDFHCREAVKKMTPNWEIPENFLTVHYADWNGPLGKGAGHARNGEIVKDLKSSGGILVAASLLDFNGDMSPGTWNVTERARKAQVPLILITRSTSEIRLHVSQEFKDRQTTD